MGKERGRDKGRRVNGEGERQRQRKKGEWGKREAETKEEG